jgi:hypothetical protein
MTERQKEMLWLAALLVLLVLFYSKILFTGKIIRAPDIINESYWGVIEAKKLGWQEIFSFIHYIKAAWNIEINSGFTTEGGNSAVHLLVHLKAITFLIPAPACVAWTIVLNFFFGACGLFLYCRTIGCSRLAAFFAALVFALSPEMASLINAGHVMKIVTISFAPWAFFCLEKGFLSRRIFWFMATAIVLTIQFFASHWQITYYTCLCIGIYALIRSVAILRSERERSAFPLPRLVFCNLVVLLFFLTSVSMALFPLANWSKGTNRGVQSGANQGKGGLERDEAMSWSLPPEETAAFVIPGLFGYSRQEAGANPTNISSYYWGRMVFTQTISYMGLLPWLLVPLPLIFRRDRYAWLAVIGIAGGVLFSIGKYTPIYHMLYDYFPGINRFRAPKMMMFIPVIFLGVLSARGLDLLLDGEVRAARLFRRYQWGLAIFSASLVALLAGMYLWRDTWTNMFIEALSQPTRYEQGMYLVAQRWQTVMMETGYTAVLAVICSALVFLGFRVRSMVRYVPMLLILCYLGDVWRVNDKFMFLVDPPEATRSVRTPVMDFLAKDSNQYRTLPMNGSDPMQYVANKIPVMFTSNAVQQKRWQDYLDAFNFASSMPDMMNVKYVVYSPEQYLQDKSVMGDKYRQVFLSPDGKELVLENTAVLPKAWLVASVLQVTQQDRIIGLLQSPQFDPRQLALVESPPPLALKAPGTEPPGSAGSVKVKKYEGERIELSASVKENSLMVLGEKYYKGWKALVDGKAVPIVPANYILRGIYLAPGEHNVEFVFDPVAFKVGKYLTMISFLLFLVVLVREIRWQKRCQPEPDISGNGPH